ncbi:hypothetical protein ES702_04120 [subsurface metagenome]
MTQEKKKFTVINSRKQEKVFPQQCASSHTDEFSPPSASFLRRHKMPILSFIINFLAFVFGYSFLLKIPLQYSIIYSISSVVVMKVTVNIFLDRTTFWIKRMEKYRQRKDEEW